ncbi:MAG TPA: CopD family protein, partial [Acidimicrobiales bacterium]|nr:CopD family protein [Acidimicrobiales bacterium]
VGSRKIRRGAMGALVLATVAAMLADVTTSHAAANRSWEWFRVGTQWVHFIAVGTWIGGLAGLLLCLGSVPAGSRLALARRYSFVAGIALLVVLLTGTLRAVDEIGTWHELFHTGFGQLVVIKVALLALLALLGAANRYRNVPAVARGQSGLRRVGGAELAVMAVVLVATGVLQNLSPARASGTAKPAVVRPIVIDTHDFATTVRLHLTVTPGTAGFNQFRLGVVDYDTLKPIEADKVALTFHYPARTDVGDSNLALTRSPDGSYAGQGANLSLQGHWAITVLIQRGLQSTDVPIDLVTETPPLPFDVQRTKGLPAFYNIHLAGGRQIQVYLDPGHPGLDQFHATFVEPSGTETNIASFNVTDSLEPAGSATPLTTRKLDNLGHYVADAPVVRGTYRFTMTATTSDGSVLGADLDIPVA